MAEPLRIHLGREEPDAIEVESASLETTGEFVVEIFNHGHARHVHVAPDDELGQYVAFEEPNLYIESGDGFALTAEVATRRPAEVTGQLRVETGYGSDVVTIDVTLADPDAEDDEVPVDESLSTPPQKSPSTPGLIDRLASPDAIPILALATIAVLLAVGAAMIATEAAVLLGVIAVLVAVGIAIVLLLR